jgi:hypothetical protein
LRLVRRAIIRRHGSKPIAVRLNPKASRSTRGASFLGKHRVDPLPSA